MDKARIVASLGSVAMIAVLAYAFAVGDFAREGGELLAMAWGKVSLVDLYVGFVLFSLWILFREGLAVHSVLWVLAVMILGSLAICLYVLIALRSGKGSWTIFFLGRHAKETLSE